MKSAEEVFRNYLWSRGLRFTRERKQILDVVRKIPSHFEAEDIFFRLRQQNVNVSQASIYRTLPLLVDSGIVRKAPCERMKARYEYAFGRNCHEHMVCVRCGMIIEFQDQRIKKMQTELAGKHRFKILDHSVVIFGLCNRCSR